MTRKPYLISGIVGNSRLLGCLDNKGQLVRLFWPQLDYLQNVEKILAGIGLPDAGGITWLDGGDWEHSQRYLPDTNILETVAVSPLRSLRVVVEDFAHPGRDILVRSFRIKNESSEARTLQFIYHSDVLIGGSDRKKTSLFDFTEEALLQFHREYWFATAAQIPVQGYQCGASLEAASQGCLNGNGHAMGSDGTLLWNLGEIAPGEERKVEIFMCCGSSQQQALEQLAWAREQTASALAEQTAQHWAAYLKGARQISSGNQEIDNLYKRSLLVFRLLTDGNFGSILAAPEIDEDFTRCGGYGYCWPRDAAYITRAYDQAGLTGMSRHFYRWLLQTQSPDGSCQQRYYINGTLAPNWGLQLDEAGSVLWGMWEHYRLTQDEGFLQEIWSYVVKTVEFIFSSLDGESGLPRPCMDLWEERPGQHAYSAAAVWAGLVAASRIASALGHTGEEERWQEGALQLRNVILFRFWDKTRGHFLRSLKVGVNRGEFEWRTSQGEAGQMILNSKGYPEYFMGNDATLDTSLLGLAVPFGLLPPDDERLRLTVETLIERVGAFNSGGLGRYQGDNYIGGNPWIITTLWLALLRVEQGAFPAARSLLEWAVEHQTSLGLLPEQVDKNTGETAWVVPLTWSHAMFVLTVLALDDRGELTQGWKS
ncbi:MAG TPA: glycoside hydrolase family 15 protein [Bacillota bacterium]|nr:glycoside hydrolase family 15 protein [Bacillota bacterium]